MNKQEENSATKAPPEEMHNDLTLSPEEIEKHLMANSMQPSYLRRSDFWEDLKSVKFQDIKNAHRLPCARTALLYGIGGGMTIGLAKFLLTLRFRAWGPDSVRSACNWAVGSFGFISIVSWEKCRYERRLSDYRVKLAAQQFKRLGQKMEKQKAEFAADRALTKEPDSPSSKPLE